MRSIHTIRPVLLFIIRRDHDSVEFISFLFLCFFIILTLANSTVPPKEANVDLNYDIRLVSIVYSIHTEIQNNFTTKPMTPNQNMFDAVVHVQWMSANLFISELYITNSVR